MAAKPDDLDDDTPKRYIEATDHASLFCPHSLPEQSVDLGEIRMNYAVAGSPSNPALLLIPGQTESWWGYEQAMHLLSPAYHVFAVDLRGQGRSTWTPGRYSLDLFGTDLVRFIDAVIRRPVIVAGLSSGGVIAAWLSAFANPGQVLAAVYEDPPLFASELAPAVGQSIRQTIAGPMFQLWARHLGPQWKVADEDGLNDAMGRDLPAWVPAAMAAMAMDNNAEGESSVMPAGPPLELREYDPEWAEAFWTGRVGVNCDHENMLAQVKMPVLFTHHFRRVDPESGNLIGASSDLQVRYVRKLVEAAGNAFTYRSFPGQPHSMHGHDPVMYVTTVTEWIAELGLGEAVRPTEEDLKVIIGKIESVTAKDLAGNEETTAELEPKPGSSDSTGIASSWLLTLVTPKGQEEVKMVLDISGNTFSGYLDGSKGKNAIQDGRIDGSAITFQATLTQPFKIKVKYKATIDGNKLTGQAKAPLLPALGFTGVPSDV